MQLQVRRVSTVISRTETRWENAIENSKREGKTRLKNRKCDSNAGSGSGSSSKARERGELNGRTWSSGHRKRIETTIKRYTMRSNAQRVIEQKDLLI